MIGLKGGVVLLESHNKYWKSLANDSIKTLRAIFKETAIDIQHIGSTSIEHIHAKPIIDIVVGVDCLDNVKSLITCLEKESIIFRGQDVLYQLLFIIEDSILNIRTHHIHVVVHNEKDWNDYINFRDYLNAYPVKAKEYECIKLDLATKFSNDRKAYTSGKNIIITKLLVEAEEWKSINQCK